jgi:prepilin-type N-terminal cleavage/methylation domain-containing protein
VGTKKAYTLIEVMLVLTILGILISFIVPNLLPFNDRWLLRSTAYMIANDIRRMQRQSVQECAEYNFEILPSQFYYKLRKNYATSETIKKVTLNPRINKITSTLTPSSKYGGQMAGYRIVTFSYLGNPSNCGNIVLETKGGSSIKLTIEVATGRVYVYD